MDRKAKEKLVAELHDAFNGAGLVVITQQSGMTVGEASDLRAQSRENGVTYKVTKNTLARIALKDTPYQHLDSLFTGPTAIAYSEDPIAAAKTVVGYAKKNEKLQIIGAGMGDKALDVEAVKQLASLPSLDELRGKIIGVLQAPAVKVAGVIQAPASGLARLFSAYATKE